MTRKVIGCAVLGVWLGCFTAAAQLPPDVMVDKYLLHARMLSEEKDHKGAMKAMDRIVALQKEHDLTLPKAFPFHYAQTALAAGAVQAAIDSANQYLSATGKAGKYYRETLDLLVKAERKLRESDCRQWNTPDYFREATVQDVTACLEAGSDPTARDKWNNTPLHWAARSTPNPEFRETALIPFFHKKDPNLVHFQTFYKKDLDGTHTLFMIRGGREPLEPKNYFGGSETRDQWLGLFLVKPSEHDWVRELTFLHSTSDSYGYIEVERVDNRSIVFHQTEYDYRFPRELKLFFNAKSGQLLKRLEYSPLPVEQILELNDELYFVLHAPLDFAVKPRYGGQWQKQEQKIIARLGRGKPIVLEGTAPDSLLAHARKGPTLRPWNLFTSPEFLEAPREYRPFGDQGFFKAVVTLRSDDGPVFEYVEGIAERVGDDYKLHKLPKTTLEDLIQARPSSEAYYRAIQSSENKGNILNEGIGPYQIVGNRFWFGKIFYSDTGEVHNGGFGYFDPDEKKYVLFRPRDVIHCSVSALLVEEKDVWLGLTYRGEGYNLFVGLMRCDRDTGQVQQYQFSEDLFDSKSFFHQYEVITQIKRWRDSLYLATDHGLLIYRDNHLIRYTFEPAINGGIEVHKISP